MNRSHRILRTGSALAALSTALVMAAPAQAQGLLASGSVATGDATAQISTSPNQTSVLINANQAIIDWRPTVGSAGATMNVLPEGNSLFFSANSSVTSFTVLNRIQLTDDVGTIDFRPIELNGTVQSRIGNGFGGNVWFYSPGGILVGATGRFDVGGLVLTTNPIDVTDGLFGSNEEIRFRGTAGSAYGVTVNSGAQISALAAGSYVAMVAPSVVMNGRVTVDGSAAYVGAEQADLRINGGLFDIFVTVGTGQAHGVEHGGVTTGPASNAAADAQRAIMVAVPKNQALTMLLSGSIGYTAATDVTQEGSAVVLSAGHDIRNGAIWTRSPAAEVGGIAINTTTVSSAVTGQATGTIGIDPGAGGTTLFQSTASFGARGGIAVTVAEGETVRALQGLSLTSTNGSSGGDIDFQVAGLVDVTGALALNTRGDNAFDFDAIGGSIGLAASGDGRIAAGTIEADAGAFGNVGFAAQGGSVTLSTSGDAVIAATATNLRANGDAAFNAGEPNITGADGVGGTISIAATGGQLLLGDLSAVAQASGGTASSGQAGSATGGEVNINITGGSHRWDYLFADVSSAAGFTTQNGISGSAQGSDTGIAVSVTGPGTLLDITQSVSLYADGRAFGGGASAQAVRGGAISVSTQTGGTLQVARDLYAQSRGDGANPNIADVSRVTPDVFGGTIDIAAQGGAIRAGALLLYAGAAAGFGDVTSGAARGGSVRVETASRSPTAGSLTLTDCPIYSCTISVGARGGSSIAGSDAVGGTIDFTTLSGTFSSTGQFYMEANGQGGRAIEGGEGQGANGTGGTITLATSSGTTGFGQLFLEAIGTASEISEGVFIGSGSGGIGQGGTVTINQSGGNLTAALLRVNADGEGGFAGANCVDCTPDDSPFTGGDGIGGNVDLTLNGGTTGIALLSLYADGMGGTAGSGTAPDDIAGIAGDGTGGTVAFTGRSGQLTADSIILSANGQGGLTLDATNMASNSGGAGTGGAVDFTMAAGGSASITTPNLIVRAEGIGGNAGAVRRTPAFSIGVAGLGAGGDAEGGDATIALASGTLTTTSISLSAEGVGGNGSANATPGSAGSGGSGAGGTATLAIASTGHVLTNIVVSASGEGGLSRSSVAGTGGAGGDGTGGLAQVAITADGSAARIAIVANGTGSNGSSGAVGQAGGTGTGGRADLAMSGGDFAVTDQLDVTANGDAGANGGASGPAPFAGSDGDGGTANVAVTGTGTILRLADATIHASGKGGAMAATGAGTGGDGTGGNASVDITAGARLDYAGALDLSTGGTSASSGEGRGGTSLFRVNGASAIAGEGGNLRIASDAQFAGNSQLVLTNATTLLGDVTLSSVADVLPGGTSRGGRIVVRNDGAAEGTRSAASITADASASNGGTAGDIALVDAATGGSLGVSGMLSLTNTGVADAGVVGIAVRSTGGTIAAGELALSASGDIAMTFQDAGSLRAAGLATLLSAGDIILSHASRADGADSLAAGAGLRMVAGGNIRSIAGAAISSGGDAALETQSGDIRIERLASIGDANLVARRGSVIVSENLAVGGAASVAAPGGIDLTALRDLTVLSAVTDRASAMRFVSARSLAVTDATGGSIMATAQQNLTLRDVSATNGTVSAIAGTNAALANVDASGALTVDAANQITASAVRAASLQFDAGAGISLTDSTATAGAARIASVAGDVILTRVTASGAITAQTAGAVRGADVSGTAITLDAGGDLALGNSVATAGSVNATSSGGTVRVADSTAATALIISAAGGVTIDGQVRARDNAAIDTPGAIAVNGQLAGGRVTLTSTDLAIASGGGILAAPDAAGGTGLLTINATGQGTTFLGGPANSAGYSLSGTEMGALRGRSITINGNGPVEVGGFTMATGTEGNFAADGTVSILSPSTLRVNGTVRIDAMPQTATLLLSAAQRIVVDPTTGVIDLRRDDAGALGGLLRLRSDAVHVATDAAISAIAGMTDPTLIDTRLAQNDGIVRPDNVVRAFDIVLEVTDGAYIQNVGAGTGFDQRRGFLATSNTVSIDTASAATRIVINGQLQDTATPATLISGLSVAPILVVNGVRGPLAGGQFDQRSRVNGCLMINPASCRIVPPQTPIGETPQSNRDAIDQIFDPNPVLAFAPPFLLATIELRDYVPQSYLPLIDEPVTGAGNDDLWQCDDDKPGCARPNP